MRYLLFLAIIALSYNGYSQTTVPCNYLADSISISSNTIYIYEGIDSNTTIDFMNESHIDLSYAYLWIEFDSNLFININDTTATGGLSSPYPYPHSWIADIEYLTTPIPPNTIVNAKLNVWNGKIDGPSFNGCELPLVFVINADVTSVSSSNVSKRFPTISPNPLVNQSILKFGKDIDQSYRIIVYDFYGREVFVSNYMFDKEYILDRKIFNSSGMYFLTVEQEKGQFSNVLKLNVTDL